MTGYIGLLLCSFAVLITADNGDSSLDESNVLVLSQANFETTIDNNQFVLVEFYAPWCGHCKALAPEYAEAADKLAAEGSPIKLGKVDATIESDLAKQYEVRGYPTLKFFRSGVPKDYNGGRKADDIVSWVIKNSGPSTSTVETAEEIRALIEKQDVTVFGYFETLASEEAGAYKAAADSLSDSLTFGLTTNVQAIKDMEVDVNTVVVYKKFDEDQAVFDGNWTAESIAKFIQGEELPLVVTFSDEVAPKIFSGNFRTHLLVFFPKTSGSYDSYMKDLRAVAKEYKGKVLFVHIDTDVEESERIMEFFSITKESVPATRLIDMGEDMKKYQPDFAGFDQDQLKEFLSDFMAGNLKPHLNSEDVPDNWNQEPVAILVGKNFKEVALDQSKHVFVEFYAPWCGHCKQLAPVWDQLGDHFKDDDDVVIAKMDATKNEVEVVQIQGFPTLKFFPKGSEKVVDYDGGRTLDELVKFVEDNLAGKEAEDEPENEPEKSIEDAGAAERDEL